MMATEENSGPCGIRLSVIIPGYRTPSDIWLRCVSSVLGNLEGDDEIICVDDASPEFPSALNALAQKDSRVKVLRSSENKGQASARNMGLKVAKGRYVAFVDSDDVVRRGTYALAMRAIEDNNADIAVYGVRVVWHNDGLCKEDWMRDECLGVLSPDKLVRLHDAHLFNYPWNKVYKRDFLVGARIEFCERTIPREDEIFNLDCAVAQGRWVVISHVGQIYYHGGGTSLGRYRRYNSESNRAVIDAWQRYRNAFPESNELLGNRGLATEKELLRLDWENLWKRESPFGMVQRYMWLLRHKELGGLGLFIKTCIFFFIRRNFYIRPIRRRHIRKLYPQAREANGRVGDFV